MNSFSPSGRFRRCGPRVMGIGALVLPIIGLAQSFSIDGTAIANGGGASSGGGFALTGTIGQATAGPVLSGGSFSLRSGFWWAASSLNSAPSLQVPEDRDLDEDPPIQVAFVGVDDAETDPDDLTLTVSSSNPALLPDTSITLAGSGAMRTLTFQLAENAHGEVQIQFAVSDGRSTARAAFTVRVASVNDPPELDPLADRSLAEDAGSVEIPLVIRDPDHDLLALDIVARADNERLLPDGSLVVDSQEGEARLLLTPAPQQSGVAKVRVEVSDGVASVIQEFDVTVVGEDDPPQLLGVRNVTIAEDNPAQLDLELEDPDTAPDELSLRAVSENLSLVLADGIRIVGSGLDRQLILTPAPDQNGVARIQLVLSDGTTDVEADFELRVTAVNDPPRWSPFVDLEVDEDAVIRELPFTLADPDLAGATLRVAAASSNPNLVSQDGIVVTLDGNTGTVRLTPETNASGVAEIELTATDGVSDSVVGFQLRVREVNDPPTLVGLEDLRLAPGASQTVPFRIEDPDNDPDELLASVAVINSDLVSVSEVSVGEGGERAFVVSANSAREGTAEILVGASDSREVSSERFQVTVGVGAKPATLAVERSSDGLVIRWDTNGMLQSADQIEGLYTTVSGAQSPFTIRFNPQGGRFFRVIEAP